MSELTGFQLAPLKAGGRMTDYLTGRMLTLEETEVRRREIMASLATEAAFKRSWRGRLAAFLASFKRAWAAFKDEDTGL